MRRALSEMLAGISLQMNPRAGLAKLDNPSCGFIMKLRRILIVFVFSRVPIAALAAVGFLGTAPLASAQATPDDLAAQAQALRQIIAQMELEAAELEPQV